MRAVEAIVFDQKHVLLCSQIMKPTRQFAKMAKQVMGSSSAEIMREALKSIRFVRIP